MDIKDEEEALEEERLERTRLLTWRDFSSGTSQLAVDTANVMENRVDILSFSKDYQQQIRNFYRFTPVSPGSPAGSVGGGRSAWK